MYVWSRLGFKCISFWWSEVFLHNRKVFPLMETEVSGNSLPNLFLCNKGYLQPFHTLLHYDPRLCEKSTQPAGAPVGLVMDWDGFGHSDTGRRKVLIFLTQFEWIYALSPLLFFTQLFPDKNPPWQFERTSNITKLVNEGRNWEVEIWLRFLWPSLIWIRVSDMATLKSPTDEFPPLRKLFQSVLCIFTQNHQFLPITSC